MRNPFARKRKNRPILRVIGGALLAAAGAGVIAMLPDIKRYMKIRRM
jgi:hypothetical protein